MNEFAAKRTRGFGHRPPGDAKGAVTKTGARRDAGAQRLSMRLTLPLAARLAALGEMHPGKSRSQLLNDLLALALAQIENTAPAAGVEPPLLPLHAGPAPVYLVGGAFTEFHRLVLKHHRRLERERAADDSEPPAADSGYGLVDDE